MTVEPHLSATVDIDDVLARLRPTLLVVDQLGVIVQALGGGGRPLGYLPEQLIGQSSLMAVAPEDHQVMADFYYESNELPVVGAPEPFPVRIVGPDGSVQTWDCVPSGITLGEHDGWVAVMTCRREQSVAIKAMDRFIEGGSPLEIAAVVAEHFNDGSAPDLRKHALVLYRDSNDFNSRHWNVLQPATAPPPGLLDAVHACLDDPLAPWHTLSPGQMAEVAELPLPLANAVSQAGLPYCTAQAIGYENENRLVFVRFSDIGFTLEGNNRLAMRSVGSVLARALLAQRSQDLLSQAARSDPLTGLANRLRFDELLDDTEDADHHAVLFVDIDRFKTVNDQFGHAAGDATLCHVANRIVRACRPHDAVARIGGDEFAVVLSDVTTAEAHRIAERIRVSMFEKLPDEAGPEAISVTVGVAEPDPGVPLVELVERADHAMLAEKSARAGRRSMPHFRDGIL